MTMDDVDINGQRRRLVVITGGNGVLGVATVQRLLEEIRPSQTTSNGRPLSKEHERIRVVLACRSRKKAEVAVAYLRQQFPNRTLLLEIEDLDLCSMKNVEDFCKRLLDRGYTIDWLLFNAGVAEVIALDWFSVVKEFCVDPVLMFTLPQFMLERVGSKTEDNLGLIFQANVFGHYYILKRLASLLSETSRVIWSTSLETSIAALYDPKDAMGIHSKHPYCSSKRFIELLHCYLNSRPHTPQFFLTHPGITSSGIVAPYQWPLRETIQLLKTGAFYLARVLGSPWHAISSKNGSCSMVYCALSAEREDEMMKWGSGSDRWGNERLIGTTLEGEADIFNDECTDAYNFVEQLYKEQCFKLGVSEN